MQREQLAGGIAVYRFTELPRDRLDALVTTRQGGVSSGRYSSLNLGLRVGDRAAAVVENRRRVFAAAGMSLERSVWCRQVHDEAVRVVDGADLGRGALGEDDIIADTDALVTDLVDVPLCVIVADCVPVVIYAPDVHLLAVAHAGWAGTVKRISSATVRTMVEGWGCDPARMRAAIGPSIGPGEYEVGPEVAEAARSAYGPAAERMLRAPAAEGGAVATADRHLFDLWQANRVDLSESGIPPDRIEVARLSSARYLADFYSHRAEGVTGRFAAIAALRGTL